MNTQNNDILNQLQTLISKQHAKGCTIYTAKSMFQKKLICLGNVSQPKKKVDTHITSLKNTLVFQISKKVNCIPLTLLSS